MKEHKHQIDEKRKKTNFLQWLVISKQAVGIKINNNKSLKLGLFKNIFTTVRDLFTGNKHFIF